MELLPEIIKITSDNLPAIITIGLTILSIVWRTKYKKFKHLFVAVIDILDAIYEAIVDDEVTLEEILDIITKVKMLDNIDN